MRNWGIVITAFYALVVLLLVVPGVVLLSGDSTSWGDSFEVYSSWLTWVWVVFLLGGQAVLLLVSVDSSWRRLKPRQHILVSLGVVALLLGLLTFAAAWSLSAGVLGDKALEGPFEVIAGSQLKILVWWLGLWLLWGITFFLYTRRVPQRATRVVAWLLRGSVLELLIAVPCHVIVRHRDDCSAPVVTGFGIATGLAVMLLSFGPSVLFLYNRRMKQYEKSKTRSAFSEEGQPKDGQLSSESAPCASSDEVSS